MVKRNKDVTKIDKEKAEAFYKAKFGNFAEIVKDIPLPTSESINKLYELQQAKEKEYRDRFLKECAVTQKATLRNQDLPLLDCQIKALLQIMNKYIFEDIQSVESVNKWLDCDVAEPIKIKNVKWLGVFLYYLKEANFICSNYQDIINKRKIFCSKKGKIITNSWISGKLSEGLNTKQESKHYQVIKEIENSVSHLKLFENID